MKVHDLANGVSILELDPTKHYWVVIDFESRIPHGILKRVDGLIIYKSAKGKLQVIENPEQLHFDPKTCDCQLCVRERDEIPAEIQP